MDAQGGNLLWSEGLCALKIPMLKILTPKVMVLGSEAFGRWLGHDGRALMKEINALIKVAGPFYYVRTQQKEPSMSQKVGPHQM